MSRKLLSKVMLLLLTCVLTASPTAAGEFNPTLSIGDPAPSWSGLIGVDGKTHSSDDLKDAGAIVVVFTCNSCPYAVDAEDRLLALHEWCQKREVELVAINANQIDADRLPMMKVRAQAKKFPFSYLADETQTVARSFGAKFTPECFVLNAQRDVAYMGSLDDSPNGKNVTKRYVEDAVTAILAGKSPAVTETVPIGCRIRAERKRRSRR